jgi:uncharacterized membrane protein
MSRSPVSAPFSCVAFVNVRLYVVADFSLMMIGVAPPAVFAAIIAPRKLQSFAAAVQARAATAAVSSVRSTLKVVAKNGTGAGAAAKLLPATDAVRPELDDAVCVNFRDAPANTMSANTVKTPLLFIEILL